MAELPELSLDKLCHIIVKTLLPSSKPGGGALVFVQADRQQGLQDLALKVASAMAKDNPVRVYLVQGHIRGDRSWSYSRIRKNPRLRLEPNGKGVTETGGVIFPQDRPIVLLAEYFDCFEPNDQRAYAHLVDGEGGEDALHEGSVLIGGLLSDNPGSLEPGAATRGWHGRLA